MSTLIIGLILFLGIHSVSIVAPGLRQRMATRLGVMGWQGLYSVIALIGLVLVVRGYGEARLDPVVLYTPPEWLRYLSIGLLVFLFPLLIATYLPGRIRAAIGHPMLAATKLWALAHLLANGTLADLVLFGAFLAWAVADRISLKRRAGVPVPSLPAGGANDAIAIVAGLALYAAFLFGAHQWLFGVSPLP